MKKRNTPHKNNRLLSAILLISSFAISQISYAHQDSKSSTRSGKEAATENACKPALIETEEDSNYSEEALKLSTRRNMFHSFYEPNKIARLNLTTRLIKDLLKSSTEARKRVFIIMSDSSAELTNLLSGFSPSFITKNFAVLNSSSEAFQLAVQDFDFSKIDSLALDSETTPLLISLSYSEIEVLLESYKKTRSPFFNFGGQPTYLFSQVLAIVDSVTDEVQTSPLLRINRFNQAPHETRVLELRTNEKVRETKKPFAERRFHYLSNSEAKGKDSKASGNDNQTLAVKGNRGRTIDTGKILRFQQWVLDLDLEELKDKILSRDQWFKHWFATFRTRHRDDAENGTQGWWHYFSKESLKKMHATKKIYLPPEVVRSLND